MKFKIRTMQSITLEFQGKEDFILEECIIRELNAKHAWLNISSDPNYYNQFTIAYSSDDGSSMQDEIEEACIDLVEKCWSYGLVLVTEE